MNVKLVSTIVLVACFVTDQNHAEAGVGKAIWKGLGYVGRQVRRVVQEGAEGGLKKTGTQSGRTTSTAIGKAANSSGAVGKRAAMKAVSTMVAPAKIVSRNLGTAGTQALTKLSPSGAAQLADVSAELARSPNRAEWMKMIAQYGDECAAFLWNRKGSVAVASMATAVMLQPDDFLQATGRLAESTVKTAGAHIVEPLINQTAEHVAHPVAAAIAQKAAASAPWGWLYSLMSVAAISGAAWWRWGRSHKS